MKIHKGKLPYNDRIDQPKEMNLTPAELTILSSVPEIVRVSQRKIFILLEESTGIAYSRIKEHPTGQPINPAKLIQQKIREYLQMLMIENALTLAMKDDSILLELASLKDDLEKGTDAWLHINNQRYPVDIVTGKHGGEGKLTKMDQGHHRTVIAVECGRGIYPAMYTLLRKYKGITDLDILKRKLLSGIGRISYNIHITVMNPVSISKIP